MKLRDVFLVIFVFIFLIFIARVFTLGMIHFFDWPEVKENSNLFYPQSGELQIKVVNRYQDNGKSIHEEQVLNNVVYAQLRLYPTIGCEKPTLFYLEEESSVIKKLVALEAELIK